MKKTVLFLSALICLTSCATQYEIEGNSTVQSLDGKMLYLKVFQHSDLVKLDSCEVVHGKFRFSGRLDSTMMGSLFMDDESVMPIVVEEGLLSVHIDQADQYVCGSLLNDTLYKFIKNKNRIDNQMQELSHKEMQMIMDGVDHDVILMRLNDEVGRLTKEEDYLVTKFITDNFNNVLGPGVFMIITSSYPYPVLTPQIEDILSKATPYFKSHPYVKDYITVAEENMQQMRYGDLDAPQAGMQSLDSTFSAPTVTRP